MLQQKYQSVLDLGLKLNVQNGDVKEEAGKLTISGTTNTPYEKDLIWDEIKKVGGDYPTDIQVNLDVANDSYYHTHTVVKGDSLWAIAAVYYKDGNKHPILSDHNKKEHIHPEDVLVIPNLKSYIGGERLQVILTVLGHDTKGIDGQVGNNTLKALKAFQSANELTATGEVDESTKLTLVQVFKNYTGNIGGKVLQVLLRDAGYDPGPIDGILGKKTANAITSFQSISGLGGNGAMDSATVKQLVNYYV
jgi:LysM repeat protein